MQPSIKLLFKKSDFLESNNLFKITICVLMRLIINMLVAFKRLTQKVVLIVKLLQLDKISLEKCSYYCALLWLLFYEFTKIGCAMHIQNRNKLKHYLLTISRCPFLCPS